MGYEAKSDGNGLVIDLLYVSEKTHEDLEKISSEVNMSMFWSEFRRRASPTLMLEALQFTTSTTTRNTQPGTRMFVVSGICDDARSTSDSITNSLCAPKPDKSVVEYLERLKSDIEHEDLGHRLNAVLPTLFNVDMRTERDRWC